MPAYPWYVYLHVNGDLIIKNPIVVQDPVEYFKSPFVVKYWLVNSCTEWDEVQTYAKKYRDEKIED